MESVLIREMYRRQNDHWWFQGRAEIVSSLIERFRPLAGEGGMLRLCDVGCGTGANFPVLSRYGKVWGVDPSEDALQLARTVNGAEVVQGRLPDGLPFTEERFDVITLTDVLEHVEQDLESVRRCSALLNPGGVIVATVPAYQWLWTRHDEHHQHYRRYTLKAFRSLFEKAGLSVQLASYCNSLLFPFMLATRVAARIRPSDRDYSALTLPPRPVNKALQEVFSSERHLLSRTPLPFGGSVVCVARTAPALPVT